jgi:hypothetical protein
MDVVSVLVIAIAAALGFGIAYWGLIVIYLALGWLYRKCMQWNFSESMRAVVQGIVLLCILAIALFLGAAIVAWLSPFEGGCTCYVYRSYLFAEVLGIFLVSRSATYRNFIRGNQ